MHRQKITQTREPEFIYYILYICCLFFFFFILYVSISFNIAYMCTPCIMVLKFSQVKYIDIIHTLVLHFVYDGVYVWWNGWKSNTQNNCSVIVFHTNIIHIDKPYTHTNNITDHIYDGSSSRINLVIKLFLFCILNYTFLHELETIYKTLMLFYDY